MMGGVRVQPSLQHCTFMTLNETDEGPLLVFRPLNLFMAAGLGLQGPLKSPTIRLL